MVKRDTAAVPVEAGPVELERDVDRVAMPTLNADGTPMQGAGFEVVVEDQDDERVVEGVSQVAMHTLNADGSRQSPDAVLLVDEPDERVVESAAPPEEPAADDAKQRNEP
jgi:hypothetical protein